MWYYYSIRNGKILSPKREAVIMKTMRNLQLNEQKHYANNILVSLNAPIWGFDYRTN
jgi:hypothetical protein